MVWACLALVLIAVDQISKAWVVQHFAVGESWPLVSGVLHLTYVQNTGAAFGMLRGQQGLFVALAFAVIVWMAWTWRGIDSQLNRWGGLLVACGAVGNLIDRLRVGYVIDFLDLRFWPVFNFADSLITVGVGLLILRTLREER
jgi:signal peptidase II